MTRLRYLAQVLLVVEVFTLGWVAATLQVVYPLADPNGIGEPRGPDMRMTWALFIVVSVCWAAAFVGLGRQGSRDWRSWRWVAVLIAAGVHVAVLAGAVAVVISPATDADRRVVTTMMSAVCVLFVASAIGSRSTEFARIGTDSQNRR